MAEHRNYEAWLDELEALAAIIDLDTQRDKYNYYTYFMRGHSPQVAIDDIRKTASGRDT